MCNPGFVGTGATCGSSDAVFWGVGQTLADAGYEADQGAAFEYGTTFQVSVAGSAVGVRYYRSAGMTAARTGHLWDAAGNLLATVSIGGTEVGWQTGYLNAPVTLTVGAAYTVSVDSNDFLFYIDPGLFATTVTDGPLTYPSNPNGVFSLTEDTFPTVYGSGNFYFVDVDFLAADPCQINNGGCDPNATCTVGIEGAVTCSCPTGLVGSGYSCNTTETVFSGVGNTLGDAGFEAYQGAAFEYGTTFQTTASGDAVGVRYYRSPGMTALRTGHLWDSSGNLLATAAIPGTAIGWQDGYFTLPVSLTTDAGYIVSVDSADFLFYNDPGFFAAGPIDDGPLAYPGGPSGSNGIFSLTEDTFPTVVGSGNYYFVDVDFLAPDLSFIPNVTPTETDQGGVLEYGTAFIPEQAGQATGIRFYRSPNMTSARTGHLWDPSGNLLATVTLPAAAVGWQDAALTSPVSLTAGSSYVVSVSSASDFYFVHDPGFLASTIVDGPVTYPGNSTAANGVLALSPDTFPTVTGSGDYFFVDMDFTAN